MRENVSIQMAAYQQRATTHYNYKAQPRVFKVETLVIRKVFKSIVEKGAGKFQANWEDPYIVFKTAKNGAYHFANARRNPVTPSMESI